jgi:hypothetical protein
MMASTPTILDVLWGFSVVANAAAACRLAQLGLHHVYRFFFAYLVFAVSRSLILLPFNVRSSMYVMIYAITAPILWVFYVLVVLELYSLVLRNYAGLYSLGRWTLYGALSFSVTVSVLILIPHWGNERFRLLFWCTTVERGVVFSLVIFLLLILFFLSRYPVALSRNIVVHCIVYTIFFLGISMTILIRNLVGHELMRELNEVVMVISAGCYLVWILAITQKGESRIVTLRHNWTVTDEQRLISQLDNINTTLLRAAQRQFGREPRPGSRGSGRIRSRGEIAMNREFDESDEVVYPQLPHDV